MFCILYLLGDLICINCVEDTLNSLISILIWATGFPYVKVMCYFTKKASLPLNKLKAECFWLEMWKLIYVNIRSYHFSFAFDSINLIEGCTSHYSELKKLERQTLPRENIKLFSSIQSNFTLISRKVLIRDKPIFCILD